MGWLLHGLFCQPDGWVISSPVWSCRCGAPRCPSCRGRRGWGRSSGPAAAREWPPGKGQSVKGSDSLYNLLENQEWIKQWYFNICTSQELISLYKHLAGCIIFLCHLLTILNDFMIKDEPVRRLVWCVSTLQNLHISLLSISVVRVSGAQLPVELGNMTEI